MLKNTPLLSGVKGLLNEIPNNNFGLLSIVSLVDFVVI